MLNPYGYDRRPPGFVRHDLFPGEQPALVHPGHGAWITELARLYDLTWA